MDDNKNLIDALKHSNDKRGELINKLIRENRALVEKLAAMDKGEVVEIDK